MRFRWEVSGVILAALLAGPLVAQFDEPPPAQGDLSYASRYVFRGVERAGASAQAAVEFTRDKLSGGAWTNLPFQSGETREVNVHAAYAWQPVDRLTVAASAAQYFYHEVPGGGVNESTEAGLTATLAAINGITPSVAYAHDFRLRADTAQASLARSIALTGLGAFLDLNLFAGWATGDDWRPDAPGAPRHDSYSYWGGEARVPYRIGPHSTVTAGLHYAESFGRSLANGPFGLPARGNLWFTLGVNLDF